MCWFLVFLPTTLRNYFKFQEKSTVLLCILPRCMTMGWPAVWSLSPRIPPAMTCSFPSLTLWSLHPASCAWLKLQTGKVPVFGAVLKINLTRDWVKPMSEHLAGAGECTFLGHRLFGQGWPPGALSRALTTRINGPQFYQAKVCVVGQWHS